MKHLAGALALGLAVAAALPAEAGVRRRPQRMVMGDEAAERVGSLLSSLTWHEKLDEARDRAAREGKLVFWVQMLGRIDGST